MGNITLKKIGSAYEIITRVTKNSRKHQIASEILFGEIASSPSGNHIA